MYVDLLHMLGYVSDMKEIVILGKFSYVEARAVRYSTLGGVEMGEVFNSFFYLKKNSFLCHPGPIKSM